MSVKRTALVMALMYAGAAIETGIFHDDKTVSFQRKEPDKCFRPECTRTRSGDKLYCSSECCKLDKPRLKQKNSHDKKSPDR